MFKKNFEDQTLQCVECGASFVFNAEDQEYYQQKRYSTPKRCPICRANRKANDTRGGGGSRGGSRGDRPMFDVVCDSCGCQTTVPFKPSSDKPVFCSDCYKKGR